MVLSALSRAVMKKAFFVFLLFACSTLNLFAAIYMKFPGIDGEVTAEGHTREIEINSLNFGVGRSITAGTTREASAPSFSEISVTKIMDIASTKLLMASVAGKSLTEDVVISMVRVDRDKLFTYCKITLSSLLVSSYAASSGGDRPLESLSLNFAKIKVEYFDPDVLTQPTPFSWDLALGKPF
jgi:type VI secretion system secreted protein Hcp